MGKLIFALGCGVLSTTLAIIIQKADRVPGIWYSWLLTNPHVVPTLLAFSALCFVIALGQWSPMQRIYWSLFRRLIPPPVQSEPITEKFPVSGTVGGPIGWLERVADHDDQNIAALIYFPSEFPVSLQEVNLNALEPFIDLMIDILNASVFDVKVDSTEGRFKWDTDEFQQPLEVIGPEQLIRHASRMKLRLKQAIRPGEALRIKALKGKGVSFNTESVTLCCSYTDRHGKLKTFKRLTPYQSNSYHF